MTPACYECIWKYDYCIETTSIQVIKNWIFEKWIGWYGVAGMHIWLMIELILWLWRRPLLFQFDDEKQPLIFPTGYANPIG